MTARRLTLTSILAARAVRVTHEPATRDEPARTTIEGLAYVRAVVEHDDCDPREDARQLSLDLDCERSGEHVIDCDVIDYDAIDTEAA